MGFLADAGSRSSALSGVEIAVAALGLLVSCSRSRLSLVRCAVFAIAAVLTFADGEPPMRFAYYGAMASCLESPGRPALAAGRQQGGHIILPPVIAVTGYLRGGVSDQASWEPD